MADAAGDAPAPRDRRKRSAAALPDAGAKRRRHPGHVLSSARAVALASSVVEAVRRAVGAPRETDNPHTPEAAYRRAMDHKDGTGLREEDPAEAARWFARAAQGGHVGAAVELAWMCWEGEGMDGKDLDAYARLAAFAAEKGHVDAMVMLAGAYKFGDGVEEDSDQAYYWFRRAAGEGDVPAMTEAARILLESPTRSSDDVEEALQLLRGAADPQEANDTDAQLMLGELHFKGELVPRNLVEARSWLELAAVKRGVDHGLLPEDEKEEYYQAEHMAMNEAAPLLEQVKEMLKEELWQAQEALARMRIVYSDLVFDEGPPFARGGFGEVHRAVLKGATAVAVKRITRNDLRARGIFKDEVTAWISLVHSNINPLMAFCDSPLLMVSELCPDGNMQTYLSKQNWAPALGASLLAGVAQGMAHLHSHDIIHGDLKCANVLVGRGGTARISDFGLAKLRRTVAAGTGNGAGPGGTPAFMAPELLSGGEPEKPSDVYAYAMLCYEVVTKGMMPFFGHRMPGLDSILAKMALAMDKEKVLRGERPKDHLDAAEEGLLVEIMDKCWQQDPRERPRFVDVAKIMEDVAVEARLMADGATASFSELSRSYSGAGGEDGGSMAPANNVTK